MSIEDELIRIKITLLGDTGVGKSAIIKRYIDNYYDDNITSNISSNFLEKIVKVKNQNVRLEVWDTCRTRRISFSDKNFCEKCKNNNISL